MPQSFPTLSVWLSKLRGWASNQSFFSIAAWYCLVAPFAVAGFAFTVLHVEGSYDRFNPIASPHQDQVEDILFFVCLSSLVLGIASLFGIRRHGVRVILWKALLGILASCFFGFVAFAGIATRVCRQ
jgi:membrane protein required for beta-lactamase induction